MSRRVSAVLERMHATLEDATMAVRLTRDAPRFLRSPMSLADATHRIETGLTAREQRFLTLARRFIYATPRSPYRRLLRHVGCEPDDLAALVTSEGLEGALRQLAALGVCVRYDEFKGRQPAVRGSATFWFEDRDFDSPRGGAHYLVLTGGSGGRPTRVPRHLASIADGAASYRAALDAYGLDSPGNLFWLGGSPTWALIAFKLGQTVDGWFSPSQPIPWLVTVGTGYLRGLVAAAGHALPRLHSCDLQDADRIVRWLQDHASAGRPIVVNGPASSAARIAVAADALGLRLDGVLFHCRSEPLTAARHDLIGRVGARAMTSYASAELPYIGFSCAAPELADDVHLCTDRYAAIVHRRALAAGGPDVDALMLTTLSAAAPKIALNAELGDTARLVERDCGCRLGDLGVRTHLAEIRSYEKLTTQGTTLTRTNVLQILEEILPRRFGGTALDYQLVEEEAAGGATVLALRADPAIGPLDEAAVRSAFLNELGRGDIVDAYQAHLIERAGALVVQRRPPLRTRAGKVLPFQLRKHAADPDASR